MTAPTAAARMTAALDTIAVSRKYNDDAHEHRRYDHPCELVPVEERHPQERRASVIVDRRQQRTDKRKDQQYIPTSAPHPDSFTRPRPLAFRGRALDRGWIALQSKHPTCSEHTLKPKG